MTSSTQHNTETESPAPRFSLGPLPAAEPPPPAPTPPTGAFESNIPWGAAAVGAVLGLLSGGWFAVAVWGSLFGFVAAWLVTTSNRTNR